MAVKLNRYNSRITAPKSQGASQAMLYGTGLTPEDMAKAEVGIAANWLEGNTCNKKDQRIKGARLDLFVNVGRAGRACRGIIEPGPFGP